MFLGRGLAMGELVRDGKTDIAETCPMTPDQKRAAKVLVRNGFTARSISKLLGIDIRIVLEIFFKILKEK